jgi:hypothetical protein
MKTIQTLEVPWSLAGARAFARDFAAQRQAEGPAEVVVLARNSTDAAWFQELASVATARCEIRGRGPRNASGHYPTQGVIALYYGSDVEGFAKAWADRGTVVRVDFTRPVTS